MLWVAEAEGKIVGSVQLAPSQKENGRHRAELQKLFVHSAFRGQGISTQLMAAAESRGQRRVARCSFWNTGRLRGRGGVPDLGTNGQVRSKLYRSEGNYTFTVDDFMSRAPNLMSTSDMILEVAILEIRKGETAEFEAAFRQASPLIASMPGYIAHELQKCVETSHRYILLAYWQTLEAHTVGFRQSPEYQEWKRLLHHFYDPFPSVEHFDTWFVILLSGKEREI